MPIYEYQCPQCQNVFEEWLSVNDETAPCPKCQGQAPRIISHTAFVLKGGGWYVTEYGNRKTNNQQDATATNESKDTENKVEKTADKKTETKTETKVESKAENKSAAIPTNTKTAGTSQNISA